MNKIISVAIFLLLLVVNLYADIISGKVISVADGDTVTILLKNKEQVRIRVHCIDAPEKKQDFGQRSKQSLSDMIFGKDVDVIVKDKDRYGRLVGTILFNSININLEQVKKGMAWVYTRYCNEKEYYEAMEMARINKVGLWVDKKPIEPWLFRKMKK
ncbi:MAG: thermonuclease family protein [Deferribacterales bacterium]